MLQCEPKFKPTSESLLQVYNQLDSAIDLLECAYMATFDVGNHAGDPLRAVLDVAKSRSVEAKATLHDMIGWVTNTGETA